VTCYRIRRRCVSVDVGGRRRRCVVVVIDVDGRRRCIVGVVVADVRRDGRNHHRGCGFLLRAGGCCISRGNTAYPRSVACWWHDGLTNVSNRVWWRRGCRCDGVVAAGRVDRGRHNKTFAHSANVVLELFEVVSWRWWGKGKVSCRLVTLGLGVMVDCVAAVGVRYGCAVVALSTREVSFKNERVVEKLAFIFGTVVVGYK